LILNFKIKKEMLKTKIINLVIEIIVLLVLIFVTVFLNECNHLLDSFNYTYILSYDNNWPKGPLIDMYLSSNSTCRVGYENLLNTSFNKNFNPGCYCNKWSIDECNKGCINLFGQTNLKYISNNSLLCGKRMNINYLSPFKMTQSNCSLGYKPCGIIDSLNHTLCLFNNDTCPLNEIQIIDKESISTIKDIKLYNISLPLNNNKSMLIASNLFIGQNILVNFKISDGIPCIYDSDYNQENIYTVFNKFFNNSESCKYHYNIQYDRRYQKVGPINYMTLLTSNNFFENNKLNKTNFKDQWLEKYFLDLYYINYFGINSDLRSRLSDYISKTGSNFITTITQSNYYSNNYDSLQFVFGLSVVVIAVYSIFYLLARILEIKRIVILNRQFNYYFISEMAVAFLFALEDIIVLRNYMMVKKSLQFYNIFYLGYEADLYTQTILYSEFNKLRILKSYLLLLLLLILILIPTIFKRYIQVLYTKIKVKYY
jgi:hypothetical protein